MRTQQLVTALGGLLVAAYFCEAQQASEQAAAQRFIRQNDTNDDNKLSRDEFPKRVLRLFEQIDANKDGFVDRQEDAAFRRKRSPNRRAARQLVPAGFQAHRDVEYARAGDKQLTLDVYSPIQGDAALPLIVWVHGGAWRSGSKDRCPALRFLKEGFVVASINYRLSHEAIYPAQIQDCKAAIRWLRANAKEYHIDPSRIGVWGSSAGGHLVALLGTSGDVESLEGKLGNLDQSSRVQAVCDFFGPTDFLQMDAHAIPAAPFKHDAENSPESLVIGGSIQSNQTKVARANPITYVSDDDPPFLVVHGDQDPLVPLHQSKILVAALQAANVDVVFHEVKGAGHGFGSNTTVDRLVLEFFHKQLKPQQRMP